jgi:hypothetical protein
MTRYFFKISNGHPFEDDKGQDLPDDETAWREAVMTVRDIEDSLDLERSRAWSLEVKREKDVIFRIDVSAHKIS